MIREAEREAIKNHYFLLICRFCDVNKLVFNQVFCIHCSDRGFDLIRL